MKSSKELIEEAERDMKEYEHLDRAHKARDLILLSIAKSLNSMSQIFARHQEEEAKRERSEDKDKDKDKDKDLDPNEARARWGQY